MVNKSILPSKKYRNMLLPIKAKLMQEIASNFKDGKFNMIASTVINYPMEFGDMFSAKFDFIEGDEKKFALKNSSHPYISVIGFDSSNEVSAANDIPFLMTLLDYINMDLQNG